MRQFAKSARCIGCKVQGCINPAAVYINKSIRVAAVFPVSAKGRLGHTKRAITGRAFGVRVVLSK
jgi:hypothetical protein